MYLFKYKLIIYFFISLSFLFLISCSKKTNNDGNINFIEQESKQAKVLLHGIWADELSGDVVMKAEGDTIYFPDSTSVPVCFKIFKDTLVMGVDKYLIERQSANVIWFVNHAGETIKLVKSSEPSDTLAFTKIAPNAIVVGELVKSDTVVYFNNQRYHSYSTINPTTFKIYKTTHNDDGLKVDNIYYDNIINISIYKSSNRLYSCDFNKHMFKTHIPHEVFVQCVLGNMKLLKLDSCGFHYQATIGIPDEAGGYIVDTLITVN